jgi:hypothetical protein
LNQGLGKSLHLQFRSVVRKNVCSANVTLLAEVPSRGKEEPTPREANGIPFPRSFCQNGRVSEGSWLTCHISSAPPDISTTAKLR